MISQPPIPLWQPNGTTKRTKIYPPKILPEAAAEKCGGVAAKDTNGKLPSRIEIMKIIAQFAKTKKY